MQWFGANLQYLHQLHNYFLTIQSNHFVNNIHNQINTNSRKSIDFIDAMRYIFNN